MSKTISYVENDTIRIASSKRLHRFMLSGEYQSIVNQNLIFNEGCRRFTNYVCTCNKCSELRASILN